MSEERVKKPGVRRIEEEYQHEQIKRKSRNINPLNPQIEDNNAVNNAINMPRRDANLLFVSSTQSSPHNNQQINFPLPDEQELNTYPPEVEKDEEKKSLLGNDNKQPVDTNNAVYSSGFFAKQPSHLQNQPLVSESPCILTNEPKLEYIKNFFKSFATGNTNKEYEDYLKAYNKEFELQRKSGKKEMHLTARSNIRQVGILVLFEKGSDSYFEEGRASKYCRFVRTIIMDFERECMEYNKPSLGDERWENCHEELFFLKYFCKKAAEVKNDMFLAFVVNEMIIKNVSKTILPSCYDKFRNKLEELTIKRQNGDCLPSFSMASGDLIVQEDAGRNHVVNNDSTQKLQKLRDENLLLQIYCKNLTKEAEKVDEKLENLEAKLRAEFSRQCRIL